jgi:MSHA pilin protein MshC
MATRARGFTLVELVVVLVLLGIVAVVALPRMLQREEFDLRASTDRVAAIARYAQKVAVAQRANVIVRVTGNTLTGCVSTGVVVAGVPCTPLVDPSTGGALSFQPPSPITIGTAVFGFGPSGSPGAQPITLTVTAGSQSRAIVVEAETGHVRQ